MLLIQQSIFMLLEMTAREPSLQSDLSQYFAGATSRLFSSLSRHREPNEVRPFIKSGRVGSHSLNEAGGANFASSK